MVSKQLLQDLHEVAAEDSAMMSEPWACINCQPADRQRVTPPAAASGSRFGCYTKETSPVHRSHCPLITLHPCMRHKASINPFSWSSKEKNSKAELNIARRAKSL
jgi:hypothetical protein